MGTIIYVILRLIGVIDMNYPPDFACITLLISIDMIYISMFIIYWLHRRALKKG